MYQRKSYVIYQVKNGFIIHNLKLKFSKGHTHIRSFLKAKSLIDLCIRKKNPSGNKKWEIESLIRITNDDKFKNDLNKLL